MTRRHFRLELIELLLEALDHPNKCDRCGKPNVSINHKIPIFKNGKNKLSNIEFCCPSCMKDTHSLGFKHGDKRDYNRKYMKWYWQNRPEKYKEYLRKMRERYRSSYYPLYYFGLFWRRINREFLIRNV